MYMYMYTYMCMYMLMICVCMYVLVCVYDSNFNFRIPGLGGLAERVLRLVHLVLLALSCATSVYEL